jgi:hypothetical protein
MIFADPIFGNQKISCCSLTEQKVLIYWLCQGGVFDYFYQKIKHGQLML